METSSIPDQKESAASLETEVLRRMLTTPPKQHGEKENIEVKDKKKRKQA